MAASSKKNDFIQIVMLTFFLCSVFFAGLGIFFSAQVDGLRAERDRGIQNLATMRKELLMKEAMDVVKDERARKASAENSAEIDTAVNSVLQTTSLKIEDATNNGSKPVGGGQSGVLEYSFNFKFQPAPIDQILRFLGLLEVKQPHLEFSKLKLNASKADPNLWTLDIALITYTGT
ncbi:MAG: hypothetical protein ACYTGJ_11400 [Planctomycetota bacterium]|jgi:hypothetical protein